MENELYISQSYNHGTAGLMAIKVFAPQYPQSSFIIFMKNLQFAAKILELEFDLLYKAADLFDPDVD